MAEAASSSSSFSKSRSFADAAVAFKMRLCDAND
jgi:hypothetical protein